MAKISDLRWRYRLFMSSYSYRSYDWSPGSVLRKPLSEVRLALVTSAGLHLPHQPPFDESIKGGDFSYREVPADAELSVLRSSHKSDAFDHAGIEEDKNVGLPLERVKELVEEGKLGDVNHRHFSFMGSITAPSRLVSRTAPEVANLLAEDGVDAVLLIPV